MSILDLRRRIASIMRRTGWRLGNAAVDAIGIIARAPVSVPLAIDKLSGIVAGCGCVDDEPEACAHQRDGGYCECPCHGATS